MINFQTFLFGLLVISTITSLVTEAVKKILTEHNKTYRSNTLAGLVALVLSAAVGVGYVFASNIDFNAQVAVYLVALVFASWLCSMVGYDKFMQAIGQFKESKKD